MMSKTLLQNIRKTLFICAFIILNLREKYFSLPVEHGKKAKQDKLQ